MTGSARPEASSAPHIDQNIDSILSIQRRDLEQRSPSQRRVEWVSKVIGTPLYLLSLLVFACSWIAINVALPKFGRLPFDPSPFALLDGVLSLAALVSTTVVLISQNRQSRLEQQHVHIALQLNLATEQKVTKVIDMLEELRKDLPMVKNRTDPQIEALRKNTDAQEVHSAMQEVGLLDDGAAQTAEK